ncbi:hypothetical protein CHS0354_008158 [Potamilus streckersoni]|uniref:Uncharacterized protein n=1 Tax=Potamilus streckersoni TaxID=2493646 RepID=A0AAE0SIN9_9BIVA|nr:hypothetical protein CHS0354_008158 [Potamilus streckersoni]
MSVTFKQNNADFNMIMVSTNQLPPYLLICKIIQKLTERLSKRLICAADQTISKLPNSINNRGMILNRKPGTQDLLCSYYLPPFFYICCLATDTYDGMVLHTMLLLPPGRRARRVLLPAHVFLSRGMHSCMWNRSPVAGRSQG